ncbi:Esterase estB [Mycobacteroides abscessus subsp. abscessus]|nr:Esterase estB [Mycobacteroides abscessus subsp. abscessus]
MVRPDAYPSGGAGMYGTADDVLLLLEAIRVGDGFLTDGLRTLMRTDHVGPQAQTRGPGWGFGYGGAVLADPAAADSPQGSGHDRCADRRGTGRGVRRGLAAGTAAQQFRRRELIGVLCPFQWC